MFITEEEAELYEFMAFTTGGIDEDDAERGEALANKFCEMIGLSEIERKSLGL